MRTPCEWRSLSPLCLEAFPAPVIKRTRWWAVGRSGCGCWWPGTFRTRRNTALPGLCCSPRRGTWPLRRRSALPFSTLAMEGVHNPPGGPAEILDTHNQNPPAPGRFPSGTPFRPSLAPPRSRLPTRVRPSTPNGVLTRSVLFPFLPGGSSADVTRSQTPCRLWTGVSPDDFRAGRAGSPNHPRPDSGAWQEPRRGCPCLASCSLPSPTAIFSGSIPSPSFVSVRNRYPACSTGPPLGGRPLPGCRSNPSPVANGTRGQHHRPGAAPTRPAAEQKIAPTPAALCRRLLDSPSGRCPDYLTPPWGNAARRLSARASGSGSALARGRFPSGTRPPAPCCLEERAPPAHPWRTGLRSHNTRRMIL